MQDTNHRKPARRDRFAIRPSELILADSVTMLLEGCLYGLSFAGPVFALVALARRSTLLVICALPACYLIAALVFSFSVAALRRALFSRVRPGRFIMRNKEALPAMFSARLLAMVERSPFAGLLRENALLRWLFFRAMGARIDPSFIMASNAVIADPWFFSAGPHCLMGVGSLITCHFAQHSTITFDAVALGEGVVIGAGALISPGVVIGDFAVVGAKAVVASRTVIGPGEYWSGNPACRIHSGAPVVAREHEPLSETTR
jgi:acetyltransferase-like isoleucine patch superfamily enzyme